MRGLRVAVLGEDGRSSYVNVVFWEGLDMGWEMRMMRPHPDWIQSDGCPDQRRAARQAIP